MLHSTSHKSAPTDVSFGLWTVKRSRTAPSSPPTALSSRTAPRSAARTRDTASACGFRLPLKLHSVESARASYNTWAASEWDRNHDGPPTYVLGENGQKRELARPQSLMQQRL